MNQFNEHINDDVLVKYLLGMASGREQEAVKSWLEQNSENERYFRHFRIIWEESRDLASKSTVDENAAWERFQQRVNTNPSGAQVVAMTPRRNWLRIAAAVTVLVIAGSVAYLFLQPSNPRQMAVKSGDTTLQDTLPDGSVVTLNRHSSITYAASFGKEREVTLEGEGFFSIAPDPSLPFILRVGDAHVRVLGTSFNVRKAKEKIEVIVETGAVEVNNNNNAVQLQPHEKAVVNGNASPVKEINKGELYNYYRTRTFVCDNTSLEQLAEKLSEAYGVEILIADKKIGNTPINTTFEDSSLDTILGVISGTYNVRVERNGNIITLK